MLLPIFGIDGSAFEFRLLLPAVLYAVLVSADVEPLEDVLDCSLTSFTMNVMFMITGLLSVVETG